MMRNYIGSQEHFEDEINARYDQREEHDRNQKKEIEKQIQKEMSEDLLTETHRAMNDSEKLLEFADRLSKVAPPQVEADEAKATLEFIMQDMINMALYLEKMANIIKKQS